MLYVLDGPAILSVTLECSDENEVFLSLTEMLDDGELCFCDEVLPELVPAITVFSPGLITRIPQVGSARD